MFTTTEEEANKKKKKIIITLKSSDGELFQVDETVALESETIKPMIFNDYCGTRCADNEIISLPNVTSKILSKVIEYCKKHVEAAAPKGGVGDLFQKKGGDDDDDDVEDLKKWDAEFVKKVKKATLLDLILAANYLNIKSLSDLTCLTVANMIRGKTPEEIRTFFNLTPEDQEEDQEE